MTRSMFSENRSISFHPFDSDVPPLNVFTAVRVEEGGGIEWPGEIDMCPDALYLRLTGKAVEDIFPSLKPTPVDA